MDFDERGQALGSVSASARAGSSLASHSASSLSPESATPTSVGWKRELEPRASRRCACLHQGSTSASSSWRPARRSVDSHGSITPSCISSSKRSERASPSPYATCLPSYDASDPDATRVDSWAARAHTVRVRAPADGRRRARGGCDGLSALSGQLLGEQEHSQSKQGDRRQAFGCFASSPRGGSAMCGPLWLTTPGGARVTSCRGSGGVWSAHTRRLSGSARCCRAVDRDWRGLDGREISAEPHRQDLHPRIRVPAPSTTPRGRAVIVWMLPGR